MRASGDFSHTFLAPTLGALLLAGALASGSAGAAPSPDLPKVAREPEVVRERLRAASAALTREDGSAAPLVADLDASPLGLSGLPPWIALMSGLASKTTSVNALLAFAAAEPGDPFARLTLGVAARLAASPEERASVRGALLARAEPPPSQPRAFIGRALADARVT